MEDNKKINKKIYVLDILSIIFTVLPIVLFGVMYVGYIFMMGALHINLAFGSIGGIFTLLCGILIILSPIAGLVLALVANSKSKKIVGQDDTKIFRVITTVLSSVGFGIYAIIGLFVFMSFLLAVCVRFIR